MMNRRDFLKRMGALGLVAAAPKIIFDYGANSYKSKWVWHPRTIPVPNDPFCRCGYYFNNGHWVNGCAGESEATLDRRLASRDPGTYHWFELSSPNGESPFRDIGDKNYILINKTFEKDINYLSNI